MTMEENLQSVATQLDVIHRRIGVIVRDKQEGWRKDLVQMRRELADTLKTTFELIIQLDSDGLLPREDSLSLRAKLSQYRAGLAHHQASYPAVSISEDNNGYSRSAAAVISAGAEVTAHIRFLTKGRRAK